MRALLRGTQANRPRLVVLILIGVVYFGLARLSLLLAFESTNASPVWPPSGFAVTMLLALGRGAWPGVAAGAFVANAVTFVTNGAPLAGHVVLASLVIALGNAGEAVLAEFLLQRWCRPERSALARTFAFVVSAGLASASAAAIGACTVVLGGFAPRALLSSIFGTWCVGDWVGMLLITPLLTSFLPLQNELIRVGRVLPTLVAAAAAGMIWIAARTSAPGSNELNRTLLWVQAAVGLACVLGLALGAARHVDSPERSAARTERALRLLGLGLREGDEASATLAPLLAGLAVLLTSLALWRSVLHDQRVALSSATEAASDNVVVALESAFQTHARSLERLATRWRRRGGLPADEWYETAHAFLADFPSFEGLEWVDVEGNIRFREALAGAPPYQLRPAEHDELRRSPRGSATYTRAPSAGQPEPLLLFAVRLENQSVDQGVMLGSVRLHDVFERATQRLVPDFEVRLLAPGAIQVGSIASEGPRQSTFQRANVPWLSDGIRVEVRASARKARTLRSALPEVILGGGSVLAAMVAALLFLAQEVRRSERKAVSDGVRLMRMNQELAEERKRAEEAARAKAEFLANMSHELRTPMSAVVGLSTLLRQTELNETQLDYVNDLELSSNLLRQLIDDILDLSKLDAGKVELEKTSFSPRAHLEKLVHLVARNATEKGLSLELEVATGIPPSFVGDPLRIAQVVLNLLSNAVKFTQKGYVRVRASGSVSGEDAELCYEISDSGAGIDATTLSRLFAPFAQADASTTRRFGGTGLGLYISRSLAQLMGAELSCVSEPGRGTTFTFKLKGALGAPVALSSRALRVASIAPIAIDGSKRARILVAEDNAVNRKIAVRLLESLGYEADVAHDGAAAVAAVHDGDFDLVLMDWQMPVMDGLQATEAIRRDGKELPIVALTANAMEGDRERCLAAGMNDYLTKPLSIDALSAMLRRLLHAATAQGVSAKQ